MRYLALLFMFAAQLSYASSNGTGILTQTATNVTGTSGLVLARNELRTYLLIQNVGTDTVIIKFNSVQSGTEGVQIPAGGNYEPNFAPRDAVYAESASGTQAIMIVEGI